MIGVTQLLNTNLDPPAHDGQSEATAYISYEQVAADGGSNGLRWFNDGTRTKQMYFDIDGTENGTGTAGWARWDSNVGGQYEGAQCVLADTGITSAGLISIRAGNSPTGAYSGQSNYSASHGSCGIGGGNYVRANKVAFSDIYFPGHTGYYKSNRFYVWSSPTTLRSDWRFNQSGNCGSYYPGTCAFPTNLTDEYDLYMNSTSSPNPDSSYVVANKAAYGIKNGYVYHLNGDTDKLFHWGQINYSTTNSKVQMKVWFKF
mgnify:FL=1